MKIKLGLAGVIAAVLMVTLFAFSSPGVSTVHADVGACGNDIVDVPDTGATFDFTAACEGHDDCYAEGGTETNRNACDDTFFAEMQASCNAMWPNQFFKRLSCTAVASTYYIGVRLGGWAFFPYS